MPLLTRCFHITLCLLLAGLFVLPGCSTTEQTASEPEESVLERPEIDMAEYEDFDPSPYREQSPTAEVEVEHDVPDELMEGRVGAGQLVTMRGYRIQVHSTLQQEEAETQRQKAAAWWRNQQQQEGGAAEAPVVIRYKQPYYRVRLGNFADRAQADQMLQRIKQAFPEAFVVPDQVTVRR